MRDLLLPRGIDEPALRAAVAASSSWSGVLRTLRRRGSRLPGQLRAACDVYGIDYGHFRWQPLDPTQLTTVVGTAATWPEVLRRLGFAADSGSARATVRRDCRRLGIDTSHLRAPLRATAASTPRLCPDPAYLRRAGPHLVAAALAYSGCAVALAPEHAHYDLVADLPGAGCQRIQVKTTTSRDNGRWQCSITRSTYSGSAAGGHRRTCYTAEEIDFFACIDGAARVYLIPVGSVEGIRRLTLDSYAQFRIPTPWPLAAEATKSMG